jgi:hypothetical protein
MDHALLGELFRCARNYHGALAEYAATMRAGGDIERSAQLIVGTSLRYRLAIDRLLESCDGESLSIVASRGRLERLRRMLVSTSRRYNLNKRSPALKTTPGRRGVSSPG